MLISRSTMVATVGVGKRHSGGVGSFGSAVSCLVCPFVRVVVEALRWRGDLVGGEGEGSVGGLPLPLSLFKITTNAPIVPAAPVTLTEALPIAFASAVMSCAVSWNSLTASTPVQSATADPESTTAPAN